MRVSGLFCLILLTAMGITGQTESVRSWQKVISANGEFSMAVPVGYIVHKETVWNEVSIVGGAGGAAFDLEFRKTGSAKEMIQRMHESPPTKGQDSDYVVGDSLVHVYSFQGEKIYRTHVSVGTKKGYYRASISAASADNEILNGILASLQLNGTPLVSGGKVPAPATLSSVKVSDLTSSEIVQTALRRKQTDAIVVGHASDRTAPVDEEVLYTRGLMVVKKPVGRFTDRARANNVSGIVKLRIRFKANGNIGNIWVEKGLPDGLTEQAIEAAKALKFVPAEINGSPVDVELTLEYTFSIY